jgi:hypothetical protein
MNKAPLLVFSLLGCMGVGCSGESPVVGRSQGNSTLGGAGGGTSLTQYVDVIRWGSDSGSDKVSCLPVEPPLDSTGDASCVVVKLTFPEGPCECEAPAFVPADPHRAQIAIEVAIETGHCGEGTGRDCANHCACEAVKAGDDLEQCLNEEEADAEAYGWCYVSEDRGDPELVRGCSTRSQRGLRALGATNGDYFAVLECLGATRAPARPSGAIGDPCVPDDELSSDFSGFRVGEVSLYTESASCDSKVCLVNHFQGRVSCPYGQTEGEGGCFLPYSDTPVGVSVEPQLVERRAAEAVTCSCRCAGPGDGPFCSCPSGTECRHVIDAIGLPGSDEWAGSYCIPEGAEYDAPLVGSQVCDAASQSCGDARPF